MKKTPLIRRSPLRAKRGTTKATPRKRNYWKNMAMSEWSKCVRKLGHCIQCGRREGLEAHHLIKRSQSKALQLDLANGACLCFECHHYAETHPLVFEAWLQANQPRRAAWVEDHEHAKAEPVRFDYKAEYERLREWNNSH
jgi:5-methylcytosine-specific restriction endonuclease McrA